MKTSFRLFVCVCVCVYLIYLFCWLYLDYVFILSHILALECLNSPHSSHMNNNVLTVTKFSRSHHRLHVEQNNKKKNPSKYANGKDGEFFSVCLLR